MKLLLRQERKYRLGLFLGNPNVCHLELLTETVTHAPMALGHRRSLDHETLLLIPRSKGNDIITTYMISSGLAFVELLFTVYRETLDKQRYQKEGKPGWN
jgi:hypothetical protein